MNTVVADAVFPEVVPECASKDLHICGTCKSQFSSIEEFVTHKKQKCQDQASAEDHPAVISETSKFEESCDSNDSSLGHSSKVPYLSPSDESTENGASPESYNSRGKAKAIDHNRMKLLVSHPTRHVSSKDSANKSTVTNSVIGDKRKKKFKCPHDGCSYSSAYPKDLQRHLRVHTGERPFLCDICKKTFNRPDKLKVHLRHHTGVKPYKCTECDYATGDSSSLKKHLRIHTDERPFRCQICQYASRNSSQLVVHLRTHTGDSPFHCPQCPNKFKINSDLKRHMRLHTGEKPYLCSFCDYRCAIKGNLKTHIRLNHSTENLQKCSLCEFATPSRKVLKQHEKSHLVKSIQCTYPQCSYSCKSRASLLNHARTHSDDRPFKCDYCPYASRQRGNVRTHIRKRHPEKMPRSRKLNVKKCASSLNSDGSVAAPDQRSQNSSLDTQGANTSVLRCFRSSRPLCVKSYKCHLCDSAFVREDSLRSHVRQHQKLEQPLARHDLDSLEAEVAEVTAVPPLLDKSESCDTNTTPVGQQAAVESGPVQHAGNGDCILNIELNEKCDQRGQVIEEALRQSGVICVPSLTLDSTTASLIPTGSLGGNSTGPSSQTTTSYFISDSTMETSNVITTGVQGHSPEEIHSSVLQAPASSVNSGPVFMNTGNLEIPLTSVASSNVAGTPQLFYLRLVPYTASTPTQQVLHSSPNGCTQILLNADDGETLQFQDSSILQTHIESLTEPPSQGFNHQLVNYILRSEVGNDANTSLVTNVENSVSGSILLEAPLKSGPTSTILQTTQLSLLPSSQYGGSPSLAEGAVQCTTLQIAPEGRTLSTLMPVSIGSSEVPVAEILGDTW